MQQLVEVQLLQYCGQQRLVYLRKKNACNQNVLFLTNKFTKFYSKTLYLDFAKNITISTKMKLKANTGE